MNVCFLVFLTTPKEVDGLQPVSAGWHCQCSTDTSCQPRELRGQRFGETRLHNQVPIQAPVLVSLNRWVKCWTEVRKGRCTLAQTVKKFH